MLEERLNVQVDSKLIIFQRIDRHGNKFLNPTIKGIDVVDHNFCKILAINAFAARNLCI